jgi:CheY-specific phosphatase CheX
MRITGPEIRQTAGYSPPAAELVAGVFRLVKDRTSDRVGPISARKLSSHLRHDIGPIKRGCDMLEAHGVIRRIRDARSHTLPRYRITPEGNWAARADAQSISDYIQRPLVDVVTQSWGQHFGVPLDLASLAIGPWEQADEDVTAFVCAAGQAEGNVAFSMNRGFLLKSLAHAGGHDFREFDRRVRNFFGPLMSKVAADVAREIAAGGFDVLLSPAVTVVNRGALLSNPRDSRYLIDLVNQYGRLKVRITLRNVNPIADGLSSAG